jgi:hypothetical protein
MLHSNNINIPSIYGNICIDDKANYYLTGLDRTGCMFCCYGLQTETYENNRFTKMKNTHKKIYDYIINELKFDHVIDIIFKK